ncbi:MAG: hypothetical protein WKF34_08585 [Pyrinomonadaceae bacterium]
MNRKKCSICGLVNSASDENCKRCKNKIDIDWSHADVMPDPAVAANKNFPFMPLLSLALAVGGGFAIWHFASAGGTKGLQPKTAAIANSVPAEKPIIQAATEQANGAAKGATVQDTIKNSKSISDANNHVAEMNKLMQTPTPVAN